MSVVTAEILEKAVNENGQIQNISTTDLCGIGENFASNLHDVKFEVIDKNGEIKNYCFVVKYPNTKSFFYQAVVSMNGYKKETAIYSKLMPDALDWQLKTFGNVKHELPVAKAYYCGDDDDIIIMENLKEKDFCVKPRQIGRNYEECKALVQALAKFHGIILAYSQENFETNEAFLEKYPFVKGPPEEVLKAMYEPPDMMERKKNLLTPIVTNLKGDCESINNAVDKYLQYAMSSIVTKNTKLFMMMNDEFNVVCHGDLWNNNIMYSSDVLGNDMQCKLIDLQIIKFCSPASDLTQFIWCSASIDVLRNHREDLIKIYYESLQEVMTDLKSELKFSFQQLWSHFEGLYDIGLNTAIMAGVMMFAPKEQATSANREDADNDPMLEIIKVVKRLMENADKSVISRLTSLIEVGQQIKLY